MSATGSANSSSAATVIIIGSFEPAKSAAPSNLRYVRSQPERIDAGSGKLGRQCAAVITSGVTWLPALSTMNPRPSPTVRTARFTVSKSNMTVPFGFTLDGRRRGAGSHSEDRGYPQEIVISPHARAMGLGRFRSGLSLLGRNHEMVRPPVSDMSPAATPDDGCRAGTRRGPVRRDAPDGPARYVNLQLLMIGTSRARSGVKLLQWCCV